MLCKNCNREFPSLYYFKAPEICRECFDGMTPEQKTEVQKPSDMHRMTTTAFTLDGYRVVENLGIVRGITVRSRSILGTIGATLQTIVGGNITFGDRLVDDRFVNRRVRRDRTGRSLGRECECRARYQPKPGKAGEHGSLPSKGANHRCPRSLVGGTGFEPVAPGV